MLVESRKTTTSDSNVPLTYRPNHGRAAGKLLLAVVVLLPNGCSSIRDHFARRADPHAVPTGEVSRGERLLAEYARRPEHRERPPESAVLAPRRAPVDSIRVVGAEATRHERPGSHGDRDAFRPVRPVTNGSIRLTGQDLRGPEPEATPQPSPDVVPTLPADEPSPPSIFDGDTTPGRRLRIPTRREGADEPVVDITSREDRISLVVRDAPIGTVLALIAQQQGLNIIASEDIPTSVSVTLQDVRLDDALNTLLTVAGYTWTRRNDIIVVSRISSDNRLAPHLQGRAVRVFPLSYVAATDVERVVAGLLSPIGTVQVIESNSLDQRRSQESIVVEDLPGYMVRVEEYVAQIDRPPRQVLIEAHVLQVDLDDSVRHGVNFSYLSQLAGTNLQMRTAGFGNPAASPSFFVGLNNNDLDSLLDCLKTTADAKTLASPKVLVVNGQEARIQIGESLGYFVTTTTETSTLQNVEFLDLGVVLNVTPIIGQDGHVLMTVRPEVSSGQINDTTGLPEEDTTEVQSTVLLADGQAMVIGGLIREQAIDNQTKVPFLGNLWAIGRAFQRRSVVRQRSEVIVALIPRVIPICGPDACRELQQIERATSPLLTPELQRAYRPWEPQLPDAMYKPRRPSLNGFRRATTTVRGGRPPAPEVFIPAGP